MRIVYVTNYFNKGFKTPGILVGFTKLDAFLGAQGKFCEAYRVYGEQYFPQCNDEMRLFCKFHILYSKAHP